MVAGVPFQQAARIEVRIKVHPRSRNFRLSIAANLEPMLSVPARASVKDAEIFLHKQAHWLGEHLKDHPEPVPFTDGAIFPLRDRLHKISATKKVRGLVEIVHQIEGEHLRIPLLLVPGEEKHMARRLRDWLKKQALAELEKSSDFHANRLGVKQSSINIRSQQGRWGSCSSSGKLNYNWRLILAPHFVLDYVAAHEVAHLCEMNHSKAFWDKVKQTLPDMDIGRDWLKENGKQLLAYGIKEVGEK